MTSAQISNVIIATNQSATTVSFKVSELNGNSGFSNVTIPKSAVSDTTSPMIYIDNQPAQSQGYIQDTNNYYARYTTSFSTHQISIVFAKTSSSGSAKQESLLPELILGVSAVIAILAISAVGLYSKKTLIKPKLKFFNSLFLVKEAHKTSQFFSQPFKCKNPVTH